MDKFVIEFALWFVIIYKSWKNEKNVLTFFLQDDIIIKRPKERVQKWSLKIEQRRESTKNVQKEIYRKIDNQEISTIPKENSNK